MIILESREKELKIINEIDKDLNVTQREISKNSGMSLGITNIILKKLINKGYVKVKQLNKKKVQYFLTPKGFTEKAKKSYYYTLKTMEILKTMKLKIQAVVLKEYKKGHIKFIIYGKGELAWLVEIAIRDLGKQDLVCARINGKDEIALQERDTIILLTEQNRTNDIRGIDVISMLSEK
ncbi:winged helix-turn-helix transcriptional regulator [bacterium]|nr:winged helix-turn-helix transcriptional regulator [bacterium]